MSRPRAAVVSEGPPAKHQMAMTGSQIAQPSDESWANGMIGSPRRWWTGHPDSGPAGALAREHRDKWLRGYRDVLGFVTLVLCRT